MTIICLLTERLFFLHWICAGIFESLRELKLPASRGRSKRPQQQRLVAAEFAFGSDGTDDSFNKIIGGALAGDQPEK